VRARRGLRRRTEHCAARVQLRFSGRDQGRRAQARGSRSRAATGLAGGGHLSEVAERPRDEAGLTRWNERPAAVQPEGRAGCVGRKGTEPGATEVAVVARQLFLDQSAPLPRNYARSNNGVILRTSLVLTRVAAHEN